jgi:ABC-type proline/glycine betaine transport system permease subunit
VLFQKSEPAALFAIAVCSMWPTLINTMVGVRAIPQDYWNVAKGAALSKVTTVHAHHQSRDAAVHVHRAIGSASASPGW